MLKRMTSLALLAFGVAGCTPGYRVHVNGYSELAEPIAHNARLFVATDPNSSNPIFERQIKASAETLLRNYGYTIAETAEAANYSIRLQAGMKSETVTGLTPTYRPHFGARGGYPSAFLFGYSSYTPYVDTYYDQWLTLKLFKAGPDQADAQTLVWVGEAMISTDEADLRETVNYLLIGCVEYLGVDTGRRVRLTIRKDDPRLLDIATP